MGKDIKDIKDIKDTKDTKDTGAFCYKASLLTLNETTIKVTVEESSTSFVSVLILSESHFSLTFNEGVGSFLLSVSMPIDVVVGGSGECKEYTLYSSHSEWVIIRKYSMSTGLKIESKYGSVIFPCSENITRRILSHLESLSRL